MRARPILVACAAALVAAVAVPSAVADTNLSGKTSQGRPVTIVVGTDGKVRSVRISWSTTLCRRRGVRMRGATTFRPPFDVNQANHLEGTRDHTSRQGRLRSLVKANFAADRTPDPANAAAPGTWSGTISGGLEVRRRGRLVNDCALRVIRWTAAP